MLLFLLVLATGIVVGAKLMMKPIPVISPVPEAPQENRVLAIFSRKKNPNDLEKKIRDIIDDKVKDYSVVVEDYTSPFLMNLSETETFIGASLNKVPILAALYYSAQNGNVNLDQVITVQPEDIQDYGTGSIRYDGAGSTYSVKTLARLMIKQSDNTAAYILANQIIGFDKLQALVRQWGLTQTDMANNKTSNKDMAILFRKIYEEKIVNHAFTQEMLSFMKDTDFETRLPGSLPKEVSVYHKVGTEVGNIHDVGIVTNGKHTYYIGVLTNDITDDAATDQLIAKVSKTAYDYLR